LLWASLTAAAQSATELLVSYLTAPYLRIPLVLHFLAKPGTAAAPDRRSRVLPSHVPACPVTEHIGVLGIKDLQTVVDGVLFEPGLWQVTPPPLVGRRHSC
jgi:hypothetical protein